MRIRVRLVSIALSGILVLLVTGLYAIDGALSSARRMEMGQHGVQAASRVQAFLAEQTGSLNGFGTLYAELPSSISAEHFRLTAATLVDTSSGITRLWVTDSAGIILHEYRARADLIPVDDHVLVDGSYPKMVQLVQAARSSRRSLLGHLTNGIDGERAIVLLEPVVLQDRMLGLTGALIPVREFEHLLGNLLSAKAELTIIEGVDTVYSSRQKVGGRFVYNVVSKIVLPNGRKWAVNIREQATDIPLRLALWSIGLVALLALITGILQERRQAARVSERSAELERLSAELLRANRAKSEFLANVSHELRTPLNAIVGFVDLLRDGVYGDLVPRQVSPVDRIAASATHLRHLVDQVLDIAKMVAGRLEVHTEPLALRPFVLDVVSEIEPLASERGLSLSIAVGSSLPRIRTDPTHLRQILTNLLGNAVKYTTTGGIAVRARLIDPKSQSSRDINPVGLPSPDKTWIALQVADSGIGIAVPDRSRIFEEFEQVDSGSRGDSVTRGTGLGLAISRRLAQLLGGEITLESEIGHGSTFTLWLPVNPVDYRIDEHRVSPEPGAVMTHSVN